MLGLRLKMASSQSGFKRGWQARPRTDTGLARSGVHYTMIVSAIVIIDGEMNSYFFVLLHLIEFNGPCEIQVEYHSRI